MPAPTKDQLKPIIEGLFAAKQFTGDNIPDLSEVISGAVAQGLTLFMTQVKVAPGIPVPPPTGPTSAPGLLI